jgi:hypothetical protein
MFGEIPSKDGWYVANAKLKDGSHVDLLRAGAALDWSKPAFPAMLYPNHRWGKCFREMAYYDEMGYQVFRAPVAKYLCREWNMRHRPEKHVIEFEFVICFENAIGHQKTSAADIVRERLVYLDLSGV